MIRLETAILAPPQRCFDLSRDVELHQRSTASSRERAVAGRTTGKLGMGDTVTWEAVHFGLRMRLTSRITEFDPPHRFVDEMVDGPFKRLRHLHHFRPQGGGTLMLDEFDFASPLGALGMAVDALVLRRYLEGFLKRRNAVIKQVAEASA